MAVLTPLTLKREQTSSGKKLRHWLTAGFLAALKVSDSDISVPNPGLVSPDLVRRMLALAAFIYLHMVIPAFSYRQEN
jgi:hypothetical protein